MALGTPDEAGDMEASPFTGGLAWPDGLERYPNSPWPVLPNRFVWPDIFEFLQAKVYRNAPKLAKGKFTGSSKGRGNLYEFGVMALEFPFRVTISDAFVEIDGICIITKGGKFSWNCTYPSVYLQALPISQVLCAIVNALDAL